MRLTLLMTAVALSTAASAAKDLSRPVLSPVCRTEVRNLCPVGSDKAAHHVCMKEKRASISDGCKAEMVKVKQERREMKARAATAPAATSGNTTSPN